MTTQTQPGMDARPTANPWTVAAWLAPLIYLVWLVVMFVLGYWVTGLFDFEPGLGTSLKDQGTAEWFANAAYFVVVAVPSWLGVWWASLARRAGAGRAATAAFWVNLVMGVGIALAGILTGGL